MEYQTGLAPEIKTFIWIVAIIAPLAIAIVISILKKIEKTNPEKIRWK